MGAGLQLPIDYLTDIIYCFKYPLPIQSLLPQKSIQCVHFFQNVAEYMALVVTHLIDLLFILGKLCFKILCILDVLFQVFLNILPSFLPDIIFNDLLHVPDFKRYKQFSIL